jgi:hypothetical protein
MAAMAAINTFPNCRTKTVENRWPGTATKAMTTTAQMTARRGDDFVCIVDPSAPVDAPDPANPNIPSVGGTISSSLPATQYFFRTRPLGRITIRTMIKMASPKSTRPGVLFS